MTGMTQPSTFLTRADHHQIYFGSPIDDEPKIFDGDIGPLIVIPAREGPTAFILQTGCYYGPVRVAVETLGLGYEPEPLVAVVPGYEITEEVTISVVQSLDLIENIGHGERQQVFPGPSGLYRLRVSARGRGTSYDAAVDQPEEDYLLTFWKEYIERPRITVGAEEEASRLI